MSGGLLCFCLVVVALLILERWAKKSGYVEFHGILYIAVGSLIFMWMHIYSPYDGFKGMKAFVAVLAVLFVVVGVINVMKSLQTRGERRLNIAKILPEGQGSSLDEIKKAKELLDAGAIDASEFEKIKKKAIDR